MLQFLFRLVLKFHYLSIFFHNGQSYIQGLAALLYIVHDLVLKRDHSSSDHLR